MNGETISSAISNEVFFDGSNNNDTEHSRGDTGNNSSADSSSTIMNLTAEKNSHPTNKSRIQFARKLSVDDNSAVGMKCENDNDNQTAKIKKSVTFPSGESLIAGHLDPPNPWLNKPQFTRDDVLHAYRLSCQKHGARLSQKVLTQIQQIPRDPKTGRYSVLSLKGEKLDRSSQQIEPLEEILKRFQFVRIDLEASGLDDESAEALFSMLEYYESCEILNLSANRNLEGRGWISCSNLIRRSTALHQIHLRACHIKEPVFPLFCRALRLTSSLRSLHLESCNLSGRSLMVLATSLKMCYSISEVYLSNNKLMPTDGIQLGNLIKTNRQIQILDLCDNVLQDIGLSHICNGLREQSNSVITTPSGNIRLARGEGGTGFPGDVPPSMITNGGKARYYSQLGVVNPGIRFGAGRGGNIGNRNSGPFLPMMENNRGGVGGVPTFGSNLPPPGSHHRFNEDDIEDGLMRPPLTGLRELRLAHNQITHAGLTHLNEALTTNTFLQYLDLAQNTLANEGMHIIKSGLMRNRYLISLGLQSCQISDEGAVALAEYLAETSTLSYLDLRGNEIKTGGLMAIALALKINTSMTCLELDKESKRESGMKDYSKHQFEQKTLIEECLQNNLQRQAEEEARRALEAVESSQQDDASSMQSNMTNASMEPEPGSPHSESPILNNNHDDDDDCSNDNDDSSGTSSSAISSLSSHTSHISNNVDIIPNSNNNNNNTFVNYDTDNGVIVGDNDDDNNTYNNGTIFNLGHDDDDDEDNEDSTATTGNIILSNAKATLKKLSSPILNKRPHLFNNIDTSAIETSSNNANESLVNSKIINKSINSSTTGNKEVLIDEGDGFTLESSINHDPDENENDNDNNDTDDLPLSYVEQHQLIVDLESPSSSAEKCQYFFDQSADFVTGFDLATSPPLNVSQFKTHFPKYKPNDDINIFSTTQDFTTRKNLDAIDNEENLKDDDAVIPEHSSTDPGQLPGNRETDDNGLPFTTTAHNSSTSSLLTSHSPYNDNKKSSMREESSRNTDAVPTGNTIFHQLSNNPTDSKSDHHEDKGAFTPSTTHALTSDNNTLISNQHSSTDLEKENSSQNRKLPSGEVITTTILSATSDTNTFSSTEINNDSVVGTITPVVMATSSSSDYRDDSAISSLDSDDKSDTLLPVDYNLARATMGHSIDKNSADGSSKTQLSDDVITTNVGNGDHT